MRSASVARWSSSDETVRAASTASGETYVCQREGIDTVAPWEDDLRMGAVTQWGPEHFGSVYCDERDYFESSSPFCFLEVGQESGR